MRMRRFRPWQRARYGYDCAVDGASFLVRQLSRHVSLLWLWEYADDKASTAHLHACGYAPTLRHAKRLMTDAFLRARLRHVYRAVQPLLTGDAARAYAAAHQALWLEPIQNAPELLVIADLLEEAWMRRLLTEFVLGPSRAVKMETPKLWDSL